MPSIDTTWSGEDMAKAAEVLAGLRKQGHESLPRFESERSGPVFARITSSYNLGWYENGAVSFESRFDDLAKYVRGINSIIGSYSSAMAKKQVGYVELVDLAGANARVLVIAIEYSDKMVPPTTGNGRPSARAVLLRAWMADGIVTAIGRHFDLLSELPPKSPEILRLLSYMDETYPVFVSRLPKQTRLQLVGHLDRLNCNTPLSRCQPQLNDLYHKIKSVAMNATHY